MARTRLIYPEAPVDDDVAVMSLAARYVWAYLPCHADRDGRLADKPLALKSAILPNDQADMSALLDELVGAGLISRYVAGGRRCIQIRNFALFQKPHPREAASELPPGEPKASLGQPKDSLGLAKDTPRRPVSVSDPVIDPVSEISPSACDPTAAEQAAAASVAIREAVASLTDDEPGVVYGPPISPPRPARTPDYFAAATSADFHRVLAAYPRKDAEKRAGVAFQAEATRHPGGEKGLADEILAALPTLLRRSPYNGPNSTRPFLETVLVETRWRDPPSAPDDPPAPKSSGPPRRDPPRLQPLTPRKIPASNP